MSMILKKNLTPRKKSTSYAIIQTQKNFWWRGNVLIVAYAIPHFAGRMGKVLTLNPCSMKNSIVSNVSETLRYLKNTLIIFIMKTLTSLKYYKNVSVFSVIGVVWWRIGLWNIKAWYSPRHILKRKYM